MNPKLKTFLLGALEAAGVGFGLGVYSVWMTPGDVVLTKAGLLAVAGVGVKVAIIYLGGYLRNNRAFQRVWTEEEREEKRAETEDQRRLRLELPPKRPLDGVHPPTE